ncbi:hypothetical protein ACIBUY_05905 [Streptomyces sp. NPDC050085]|uniref:hypothetical protein n=1 Tax=Streptomyces sp. NPDC050085 TaxID=3365600 RepID=UPI0037952672
MTTDTITKPVRDYFGRRALKAYKADLADRERPADEAAGDPPPVKPVDERGLYAGMTCAWCTGFWIVLTAFAVRYWLGDWPETALGWAAAAAQVAAASWLVGALNQRYAR